MSQGSTASPAEAAAPEDVRLGRHVAVFVMFAVALVFSVLHAVLPASPFQVFDPETKTVVRTLMPEGWAFFTKSPRSPNPLAYQYVDGRWQNVTAGPLAVPDDLMGLDRGSRAQGTEMAILLAKLSKDDWRECEEMPSTCLSQMDGSKRISNPSHQTICGDIGFVIQEVLPWAWRDAPTVMPSRTARARVAC